MASAAKWRFFCRLLSMSSVSCEVNLVTYPLRLLSLFCRRWPKSFMSSLPLWALAGAVYPRARSGRDVEGAPRSGSRLSLPSRSSHPCFFPVTVAMSASTSSARLFAAPPGLPIPFADAIVALVFFLHCAPSWVS